LKIISGIYKIQNLINNKIYIGQSINTNNRLKGHHKGLQINKHLQNSWNKYGEQNFNFKTIKNCEENQLDDQEIYWIEYYKSDNPNFGYNKKSGGSNGRPTKETKNKISQSTSGNKNPFYGKKHSNITIEGIRKKQTGKKYSIEVNKKKAVHLYGSKNGMFGKKLSNKHIQAIINANKGSNNCMYQKGLQDIWAEKYSSEIVKEKELQWKNKISKSTKGINNPMYGKIQAKGLTKELIISIYLDLQQKLDDQFIAVKNNTIIDNVRKIKYKRAGKTIIKEYLKHKGEI